MRTLAARAHLQRLAVALATGTAPQDSLRRSLGDNSLTLDFAVAPEEWVDAVGRPSAGPVTGQVTTQVLMEADRVARVHHAPDSGRAESLAASLTPELLLAIEHARLTARLEAQVPPAPGLPIRVVEAADEARAGSTRPPRREQQKFALGFDLRRALAAAPEDACLARSMEELTAALDDLRTLASGVHPALLTTAGLGPALELVKSRCPNDVRTLSLPERRFASAVERTAYLLVVDMASRGDVEVTGSVADGSLRLQVMGAPMARGSVVPERVTALGGTLVVTAGCTEVTLPCG